MSHKTDKSEEEEQLVGFDGEHGEVAIPNQLPVLPLRGMVVFPAAIVPLLISRASSLKAVEEAMTGERILALAAQKIAAEENPAPQELHQPGTAGRILRMMKFPDHTVRVIVQGLRRIRIEEFIQTEPYFRARTEALEDTVESSAEVDAVKIRLANQFADFIGKTPYLPDELQMIAASVKDASTLADLIASNLNISLEEKQDLLGTVAVSERMAKIATILSRELELLGLGQKIHSDVQNELSKHQKDFYLRQQMRAIQKELGEGDARESESDELSRKLEEANPPEDVRKAAEAELERLRIIPVESAEHTVVRNYLEWLVNMPWSKSTEDNLDIPHAREVLDEDHYDLEKIKDRMLEFLAVRKLKQDSKGPILCFVGPPGTGKTSLGRSIARAMERKFVRMSLGGMRDEAEIRGHRRTYIGSMPGRIIRSLRNAGSNNPLFMLDEIDKLGMDFRGDPASALLEVLDPEQNNTFQDHFLDVPFDLSKVMFITTANLLDPIPPPLRDRMEIIELAGYTDEEKVEIAHRHLIPKQLEENGIGPDNLTFPDDGLLYLIHSYTREAGLRNLEREIGSVCRKVARAITEGKTAPVTATPEAVRGMIGPERCFSEVAERTDEAGVATGLVWTPMGGDIIFIEATKMAGKKGLLLTGHLGDVMKESAQAALSYIRAHAEDLGIDAGFFESTDLHVHVPAGAVPKDGPSAGVTIAAALTSLLTGRIVRHDIAMTGEITLRGKVLPVGGVKEKVLGARRAGITTVLLPRHNEKDLEDVPSHIRDEMTYIFVDTISDILDNALEAAAKPHP